MVIPRLSESAGKEGADYTTPREDFIRWWWTRVRDVMNFAELSSRVRALEVQLNANEYRTRLLDEDGEHMIAIGVDAGSEAITIQSYWDDDEGASVAALFATKSRALRLAIGVDGSVTLMV